MQHSKIGYLFRGLNPAILGLQYVLFCLLVIVGMGTMGQFEDKRSPAALGTTFGVLMLGSSAIYKLGDQYHAR